MKYLTVFIAFFLPFILGCVGSYQIAPELSNPRSQIRAIHVLPYLGYLRLIDGGEIIEDVESEEEAEEQISGSLKNLLSKYFAVTFNDSIDDSLENLLKKDMASWFKEFAITDNIFNVPAPEFLAKFFSGDSNRFQLCILHTGFSRSSGNFDWEQKKALAVTIATLGNERPEPVEASSVVKLGIYDKQAGKIVYYSKSDINAKPFSGNVLYKQISELLQPIINPKPVK